MNDYQTFSLGKRKTAKAEVSLSPCTVSIIINCLDFVHYLQFNPMCY